VNDKSHFVSWHGLLGVITVVYMSLQCCGGLNLLYPQAALHIFRLVSLKQLHATSALLLFSLAVASLVTGMLSNWFAASVTGTSWYMCAVCPMLILTMLASQVNSAYFSAWDCLMHLTHLYFQDCQETRRTLIHWSLMSLLWGSWSFSLIAIYFFILEVCCQCYEHCIISW